MELTTVASIASMPSSGGAPDARSMTAALGGDGVHFDDHAYHFGHRPLLDAVGALPGEQLVEHCA